MPALPVLMSAMLRLALLTHDDVSLRPLITTAFSELLKLESTIVVPKSLEESATLVPQTFHHARGLHDAPDREPLRIWGETVETLWRVAMTRSKEGSCWDKLTCRMLVWRSIMGEDGTKTPEWVRKEVVINLRT